MNKKVALVARILLGLIFTVFGTNGLMMMITGKGFIPMPPPSPAMSAVMGGLFAAKYLMPLVKIIEFVAGIMLLSGRCVPLAVCLLAPVVVNILGIHVFVDQGGLPMALLLTALMVVITADRWENFKGLFCCK